MPDAAANDGQAKEAAPETPEQASKLRADLFGCAWMPTPPKEVAKAIRYKYAVTAKELRLGTNVKDFAQFAMLKIEQAFVGA